MNAGAQLSLSDQDSSMWMVQSLFRVGLPCPF